MNLLCIDMSTLSNAVKNEQQPVKRGTTWSYDADSDDDLLCKLVDTSDTLGDRRAAVKTKRARMEMVNSTQLSLVQSAFGGYCQNYF